MEEDINKMPDIIKKHLKTLLEASGLPDTEDSFEKIARLWLDKKRVFEAQIKNLDMLEVQALGQDDPRGGLILTYSGSLLSIGTKLKNSRWAEYSSIKLRQDVPDIAIEEHSQLARDITLKEGVAFTQGPIKSSSSLLKIAVCKEGVSFDEQEKRIREATVFLTNGFVKINRTILADSQGIPDQFTTKAMVSYLAKRNGLTIKKAKDLLQDYFYMLESGILLGERVPLGRFGRLYLKLRPAQKARIGINPRTGEKKTIGAKPETYIPKISFSRAIKAKAEKIPVPQTGE